MATCSRAWGPEETHFVLIFDDGAFSEFGTFSSTDWLGSYAARGPLQGTWPARFGLRRRSPRKSCTSFRAAFPRERFPALHQGAEKISHKTHRYPLMAQLPHSVFAGGEERRVSALEFPISTTMTGVVLDLKPGGLREPHWHPNADEWQYYVTGKARMTVFGSDGRVRTEDFNRAMPATFPAAMGTTSRTSATSPLRVLIGFNSGDYQEISLSTWLAANPDASWPTTSRLTIARRRAAQETRLHRVQGWAGRMRNRGEHVRRT